jgi:hypothetical protein
MRAAAVFGLSLAELAALIVMGLPGVAGVADVAGVIGAHLVFALAAGAVLAGAAPPFVRHTSRQIALFAAVVSFFVPVVGPPGVLAALRFGLSQPRPISREPWLLLERPRVLDGRHRRGPRRRKRKATAAEISEALRQRTPERAQSRFAAVLATRDLPAKIAVPLLRTAQSDPSDEVRLYAFSRLETMRSELERQIDQITASLEGAAADEAPRLHLRLAECYWELGYEGLAEGAVLEHALDSAHRHAAIACELLPENAPAEFFLGRILVRLRETARAELAFERAFKAGYPRVKLLPYLAECAFHQRDYEAVRLFLKELESSSREDVFFRPVVELWSPHQLQEKAG